MSERYANSPIIEAVVDFRFGPAGSVAGSGARLVEAVAAALGEAYPARRRVSMEVVIEASVAEGRLTTAAKQSEPLTFLVSADGTNQIACGDGNLSVHDVAPYSGWDRFVERVESAMEAGASVFADHQLVSVAVRYINRIVVRDPAGYTGLFNILPHKVESMPEILTEFQTVVRSVSGVDGTLAQIAFANGQPDAEGNPVAILDIQLRRTGTPVCGNGMAKWRPIVDDLHNRVKAIFEDSITDLLREQLR